MHPDGDRSRHESPSSAAALIALAACLLVSGVAEARPGPKTDRYQYLSPRPGAIYVQPENNLLIRPGDEIDPRTLDTRTLRVVGSISGRHEGVLRLADDRRTLIFRPHEPFAWGERVSVRLRPGIETTGRRNLPPLRYEFTIAAYDPSAAKPLELHELLPGVASATPPPALPFERPVAAESAECCACSLSGLPETRVLASSGSRPGRVFLAPFFNGIEDGFLAIVDDEGEPIFAQRLPGAAGAFDFKRQPNGWLTYFHRNRGIFYALDSEYALVDSFGAGNGYVADLHELQLLPDGHALLMCYDRQPVPMDEIVPGGDPNAIVIGLVVQELDREKEVVYQWRSWDDMEITDMRTEFNPLTATLVDYIHGNSIELDRDGHLLVSSRHINEITKLDRIRGGILWRFGGNARKNEFTILGDPRGFSHQHDARRLANGNLMLYDNGTYLDPEFSRALEYEIDEERRTARLVWEYRNVPHVFGGFMGNVQRHPDGGVTICWGGTFGDPKITDLDAQGRVVWEADLPVGHFTYRAFRFPWETSRFRTEPEGLDFGSVAVGERATLPLAIRNESASEVTITCVRSTDPAFEAEVTLPLVLAPGEERGVEVAFEPGAEGDYAGALHVRQVAEHELVGRRVTLRGRSGAGLRHRESVSADSPAAPRIALAAPAGPIQGTARIGFELSRAEDVELEVFDARGRRVARLAEGPRAAGRHEISWSPRGRPAGLYFLRLRAGDLRTTSKLILLP